MGDMEIIDELSGLFAAFSIAAGLGLMTMVFGILLSYIASILFE